MDLHCVVRAAVSTEAQSLPIWNHRSLEFFGRWLGHHFRDQLLSPVIVEGHGVARNMDGTGFKKTQFSQFTWNQRVATCELMDSDARVFGRGQVACWRCHGR